MTKCTKIYIDNHEEEYYRKLGISIYEGPRGGKYICQEDVSRLDMTSEEQGSIELNELKLFPNLLREAGFNIDKVVWHGDGVEFYLGNEARGRTVVHIGRNSLEIFTEEGNIHWIIRDNPQELIVGYRLLISALKVLKDNDFIPRDRYKDVINKSYGPFKYFMGRVNMEWDDSGDNLEPIPKEEQLIQAIVFESLRIGSTFVDSVIGNITSVDDFKESIKMVFGPWLVEDVIDVYDYEINDYFKRYVNSREFWNSLIQMVGTAYSLTPLYNFKVVFTGKKWIYEKTKQSLNTYAFYWDSNHVMFLPVDREFSERNYNYIGVMWHEFGHYISDVCYLDEDPVHRIAERWAWKNKLTEYAKTNGSEAFSEFLALLTGGDIRGRLPVNDLNLMFYLLFTTIDGLFFRSRIDKKWKDLRRY